MLYLSITFRSWGSFTIFLELGILGGLDSLQGVFGGVVGDAIPGGRMEIFHGICVHMTNDVADIV